MSPKVNDLSNNELIIKIQQNQRHGYNKFEAIVVLVLDSYIKMHRESLDDNCFLLIVGTKL